jgi:hephaestin
MKGVVWAVFLFAVGGLAQLAATPAAPQAKSDSGVTGRVRTYYVAAEEVEWDYAPLGMDMETGKAFEGVAVAYTQPGPNRIGHVYRKALYREYTDATFATRKPRLPQDEYLGLLGPILRAEVGETIKVVFKNNASRPFSMHPHGVFYEKASEGSMYADNVPHDQKIGSMVPPGATFTYEWGVPERAGPGPEDPSSIVWLYHSHVDEYKDVASGLVGAIIVTRPGQANADGTPKTSTAKSSRSSPDSTKTRVGMCSRTWPPTSAPPTSRHSTSATPSCPIRTCTSRSRATDSPRPTSSFPSTDTSTATGR